MKTMFWVTQLILFCGEFFGMFVMIGKLKGDLKMDSGSTPLIFLAIAEAVLFLLYLTFSRDSHAFKFVFFMILGAATVGAAAGFFASLFGSQYAMPWFIGTGIVCLPISALLFCYAREDNPRWIEE